MNVHDDDIISYDTEGIHGAGSQSVDPLILQAVKEASKEYKDVQNYEKLCEEHAEKVEQFLKDLQLRSKLQKLSEKHNVEFPQIDNKSVHFTIRGHNTRFMYVSYNNEWGIFLDQETPESKAFMTDLIEAGIITEDGKANLTYGWD